MGPIRHQMPQVFFQGLLGHPLILRPEAAVIVMFLVVSVIIFPHTEQTSPSPTLFSLGLGAEV